MNKYINSNQYFDSNFETAYNLCENNFTHEELVDMLNNGTIPEKQIAAIKFDNINNEYDAEALLNNLTGCDGKIREAAALRLNSLLSSDVKIRTILAPLSASILADASIDINANICRLAVDSAALLIEYSNFSDIYTKKILKFTEEALSELDKFIFRDKKYVINKQLFKLYWCLEAINVFKNKVESSILRNILTRCTKQAEYTIREKAAQIISLTKEFNELKNELLNDNNYYVRAALHH